MKRLTAISLTTLINVLLFNLVFGGNPVIKDIGMSDPHVQVFNDTLYLFTGHDATPTDVTWVMRDWKVYSSTDLLNWNLETTITPKENYMPDNSTNCWAGDAAERNGKYYWFFSNRNNDLGVMSSNSPNGPYTDALGHKLVDHHDPTVIIDDDVNETPYIVYGSKEVGGYKIAQLNEDMVSLAETPKTITINGTAWQNAPSWMDKNYIFKHNDSYYLSWGRDYAMSSDIYGPYESVGAVGDGHKLDEYAHGSFFWWKGQFYHIWCYYITSGFKYRESIITYCHFDDNGNIVTDTRFLDKHFGNGVGQYKASWDKTETEWYSEVSTGITKAQVSDKNFKLTNIGNESWIRFANVDFNKDSIFKANYNYTGTNGSIEVRLDNPLGILICELDAQFGNNITDSCSFDTISGRRDLFLVFKTDVDSTFEIDWHSFIGESIIGHMAIPGTIEAEDFHDMSGIQVEVTQDVSGNKNVGYIGIGDWLEYIVNVETPGKYVFEYRVAAKENNIKFDLIIDDSTYLYIDKPYTGGFQTWDTFADTVELKRGVQTMRIAMTGERWNINWIKFTSLISNYPPSVSITNPLLPYSESEPYDLSVSAQASDVDGSIEETRLYLNEILIGVDELAPFEWMFQDYNSLEGLGAGEHLIKVTAMDDNGLVASDSLIISIASLSTINSTVNTQGCKIFPNPCSLYLTVLLEGKQRFNRIVLIDISGRTLYEREINNQKIAHLNESILEPLSVGTYFIVLKGDNSQETFILNKE